MVTKVLNIDVKDSELDELESKLKGVDTQMNKVEGESKKADNALKKVGENGGAISTLDAFTGGLATRIRDAAEATKVFNFSLKGTRTALIATGIGAFVVALGLIVAYWDDIVDLIQDTNNRLERQIETLHRKSDLLKEEVSLLEKQQQLLELQGKDTDGIIKAKIEQLQIQIGINGAELANLQILYERIKARREEQNIIDKAVAGAVTIAQSAASIFGNTDSIINAVYGDVETLQDVEDKINEINNTILDAQIKLQELRNEGSNNGGDPTRGPNQDQLILPTTGVSLSELQELGELEFDALSLQQTARTRLEEEQARHRKWIAEQEARAKVESYMLAADGFATASQLIGQETAAGKALAVSSTLISTYLSAQKAYQSQISIPTPDAPFRATAAAAIAVAAGLANVKNIISTEVPGYSGGGGGSISRGGQTASAPAFNIVDSSPQNQLNQALLQRNGEPVEAFVVDKKVTSSQELRRQRQSASSFG